ncbi:ParB/RepB/Spo0J family partition protein [Streptomyces sp. NPDC001658]
MAGRRTSLAALAGTPVEDVPGQSQPLLMSLPLDRIVPTRFNPRRRFGTEDELRDFGHKLANKQLQPAVVVSRAAYLKLWPEEADHVGAASYVIANGERRYRASLLVGRPTLEVVHKEDVAASRATFLDAVQSENNDRENLDPIERALGIDIMVTQLGGADQVAVYYSKTKGWVSQQRKLLKLTPELQDLVSSGEMPIRVARDIAGLPAEVQYTAWEEEIARRKAAKEAVTRDGAPRVLSPAPEPVPARFTAVNSETASSAPAVPPPGEQPARFTAVNQPEAAPPPTTQAGGTEQEADQPEQAPRREPAQHVPEPRTDTSTPPVQPVQEGRKLPYDQGQAIGQHLAIKMDPGPFLEATRVMATECWDKAGQGAAFDILHGMLETAIQRNGEALLPMLKQFLAEYPQEMQKT